jgi:hypothetical protein
MANRDERLCWIAAAAAAFALTALGTAADAAVVCQKGAKVKLRAGVCKPQETQLAILGGGADATGIWEFTGGTLFEDTGYAAEFLVLEPDGSGRLNLSSGDGPALTCGPLRYSVGASQSLVLDDFGLALGTRVFGFELEGDDRLELVDAVGRRASFERASAVDPDRDCGDLVKQALHKGLPDPQQAGLVFDGTALYYGEDSENALVAVDPATGTAGGLLRYQGNYVHAAASGGDFWTYCGCGENEEAIRTNRDGDQTVDTVETGVELREEIGIEAIASDPVTGVLWLFGWTDESQGRLLKVDASGEPDVLLAAFDLDASITGLSFGGNALWAMNSYGQTLMRIDPATGAVTATFLLPDRSANWRSIAAVDDQLFLLGDRVDQGALLVIEMP